MWQSQTSRGRGLERHADADAVGEVGGEERLELEARARPGDGEGQQQRAERDAHLSASATVRFLQTSGGKCGMFGRIWIVCAFV